MQNRKVTAPVWSKIILAILCIATVLLAVLYVAIHGNRLFGWGIPFAEWAELYGLQALYQDFLLPTGLFYFVAVPLMITLFWGVIVLLLKLSAKERLALAQAEEPETFPEAEEATAPEDIEEPEMLPEVEETVSPVLEEEVLPEQECPAQPVSEPVPVMAKRLSAEEIREMYRKSLAANKENESEDPLAYLSELYYQNQEEKY